MIIMKKKRKDPVYIPNSLISKHWWNSNDKVIKEIKLEKDIQRKLSLNNH